MSEQPEATQLLFASMQWRVQESHLQGELSQTIRDKDEAQKQCADLQRRHAQAQHEIRRKVHSRVPIHTGRRFATSCQKAQRRHPILNTNIMLFCALPAMHSCYPNCMSAVLPHPPLLVHIG